jgi:hypothetical protein
MWTALDETSKRHFSARGDAPSFILVPLVAHAVLLAAMHMHHAIAHRGANNQRSNVIRGIHASFLDDDADVAAAGNSEL